MAVSSGSIWWRPVVYNTRGHACGDLCEPEACNARDRPARRFSCWPTDAARFRGSSTYLIHVSAGKAGHGRLGGPGPFQGPQHRSTLLPPPLFCKQDRKMGHESI